MVHFSQLFLQGYFEEIKELKLLIITDHERSSKVKPHKDVHVGEDQDQERVFPDGLKNVVLVFLENARDDLMPFNQLSKLFKDFIKPNVASPTKYFETLTNKGMFMKGVLSSTGYTIKSLASTLCSQHLYLAHFTNEATKKIYQSCLLVLL